MFSFLSFYKSSTGILVVVSLLTLNIRLQIALKPYKESYNNNIEIQAVSAGLVTIYTGLIFTQDSSSVFKVSVFVFAMLVNAWFILGWAYLFSVSMSYRFKVFKSVSSCPSSSDPFSTYSFDAGDPDP